MAPPLREPQDWCYIEKVFPGAEMKIDRSLVPMEMERYACVGGHLVFMDYLYGDRKTMDTINKLMRMGGFILGTLGRSIVMV